MNLMPKGIFIAVSLALGALLFLNRPVSAEIYKWTDDSGKTHYASDKSKIPRKYLNSDQFKEMLGSGKSRGGSTSSSKIKSGKDKKEGVLSEDEEALILQAQDFLNKETQFVKDHGDDAMTPTSQRLFLNAYEGLLTEQQQMLSKLSGAEVPALQAVVSRLTASVTAAKANPVGLRRMSIATTLDRVKSEAAGNSGLARQLEAALEESKKNKEKEDKHKADSGAAPKPKK